MSAITRRRFVQGTGALGLGLLAGCGWWPGQAPSRTPRIGYLSLGSAGPPADPRVEAFRQGLGEFGYVEGQTLLIDWRFAEGRTEVAADFAMELMRLGVDLIVDSVIISPQLTSTIPIVAPNASDPVGTGLVANLARPGGNVTGLSLMTPGLSAKLFFTIWCLLCLGSRFCGIQ